MLRAKRKSGAVSTTLKLLKNILQRDVLTAVRKIAVFWNSTTLGELRKGQGTEDQTGLWA